MRFERLISIDATTDVVWPLLTEDQQIVRWQPDIVANTPREPGPARVGLVSTTQIREGKRIVEYETEITGLDPETFLEITLRGGSLGKGPMVVGYHLAPDGGSTLLRYTGRWQPYGLVLRLMTPLIALMGRRNSRNAIRRLKELAESERSTSPGGDTR